MTACTICGTTESARRSDTGKEVWYKNPSNSEEIICNRCFGKYARTKRGPVIHSEATKLKISERLQTSPNNKGKPAWNKNKKCSPEWIENNSKAHQGQVPWNGAVTTAADRVFSYGCNSAADDSIPFMRVCCISHREGRRS